MSDVTPAGPLSAAIDGLRTLLANTPQFQTWTSTGSAAAALGRIFTGEFGYPITSATISGGVLTVATREPHTMLVGNVIDLEGAAIGPEGAINFAGSYTLTAVTATTISMATGLPDAATEYPDQAFVFPCVRPVAVICDDAKNPLRSRSVGTGGASIYQGSAEIFLEADTPGGYVSDARNALYQARNDLGNLIATIDGNGLMQTQGTGDFMTLNSCEIQSGPEFIATSEQTDNTKRFERWRALLRVTWGLES
jgi:hypothetical protein